MVFLRLLFLALFSSHTELSLMTWYSPIASASTYLLPKASLRTCLLSSRHIYSSQHLADIIKKTTQNWAQICLAAKLAPPPGISQSWWGETSEPVIQSLNLRDTYVHTFFFCLLASPVTPHLPHAYLLTCFSRVWLFATPVDCSPPGSSVQGISQARILEWVAISFSRISSSPRDQTHISLLHLLLGNWVLYH